MAAYHTVAFAQNQAAIRERDGRLPHSRLRTEPGSHQRARWPPTTRCPNYTQVDGHQRARWPPTTQSPSHRTRQPSESAMAAYHAMSQLHPSRRPSKSTMAAYHTVAFAQNQAAIRERDGRLPRRADYHKGTPPSPYLLVFGDDRVRSTREQMILQVVRVRLSYGARIAWEFYVLSLSFITLDL
ncbi:hypothetical protein DEO72_LG1g2421 [Vigna unguiculata]|uniref:Uncharacterized protein n=1 Tax=Vigna unguiculata TaxID=3917 RepID=A0A4D6KQC3_VIGUN|nr:hypothetical protein DEO72_LG1g2421 [Vigna unguiculata]